MRDDYPIYENIILPNKELYFLKQYQLTDYPGDIIPPHYHLMYEMMWFEQASGVFTFNGECFPIKDHTLVFIPTLMTHELQLDAARQHLRYLFQFESELINKLSICSFAQHKQRAAIYMPEQQQSARIAALFSWCAGFQDHHAQQLLLTKALALLLEDVFSLQCGNNQIFPHQPADFPDRLLKLLYQMENQNNYEITTAEAAQGCSVSKSYFSRCFKTHFGMTFKEYLLLRKLKLAMGLLSSTEMKIADISQLAGFTDGAYFTLKFRLYLGCTPSEFRGQIYNNNVAAL
ncbi:helix-turn-helix domain-containing protein [Pantoea sp. B65]|uniref:helix-turn-helix transcriptional regulator n=1 Tax=Pantoea sp. B65 TaxID=2813359 RepID=UPI0039B4B2D9